MSRSRKGNTAVNVELFPFLAVLMCTMGALILVLVAIARHSSQQAQAAALADPRSAQREEAKANLLSRAALLEQDQDVSAEELARRQRELAELDEQGRQLRQRLAELEAELADKANVPAENDRQLQTQIDILRRQIADSAAKLEKAKRAADGDTRSFAVIPYIGPNGTRRRPIYIECRGDAVILQPEGIVLAEADFPENIMNLNPLSAAVQAAVTYYERTAAPGAAEDPYPLLLVRPDGIGAYYAARAALKSWDADFGYEFVEQDWKLRYDSPNSRLADMQRTAVQSARGKQRLLALASPKGNSKQRRTGFRVSGTGGGMVRDDNGQPVNGQPNGGGAYDNDETGGGAGGGFALSEPRTGGNYPSTGASGGSPGETELSTGQGGAAGAENASGDPLLGGGTENGQAGNNASPSGASGSPGGGRSGGSANGAAGGGSSGKSASTSGQRGESENGAAGGSPPGSDPATDAAGIQFGPQSQNDTAAGQKSSAPLRPGEFQDRPTSEERRQMQAIAKKRGANWALPESPNSIALIRPVRVLCAEDHLVLVPERRGDKGGRRIELGPRTEDAMPELVSGVWDQMTYWGIAGKGMYWRPTLQVEVQPGGEERYQQMAELLEGSGLAVREKKAKAATPRASLNGKR